MGRGISTIYKHHNNMLNGGGIHVEGNWNIRIWVISGVIYLSPRIVPCSQRFGRSAAAECGPMNDLTTSNRINLMHLIIMLTALPSVLFWTARVTVQDIKFEPYAISPPKINILLPVHFAIILQPQGVSN
jgi:hypothetical protein